MSTITHYSKLGSLWHIYSPQTISNFFHNNTFTRTFLLHQKPQYVTFRQWVLLKILWDCLYGRRKTNSADKASTWQKYANSLCFSLSFFSFVISFLVCLLPWFAVGRHVRRCYPHCSYRRHRFLSGHARLHLGWSVHSLLLFEAILIKFSMTS